jgi:hypothetical protein
MSTNIQFGEQNMTTEAGYFYMFDEDDDMLFQKTDDGVIAFSYPLDTVLTDLIYQLEYDGVNFWTLEQSTAGQDITIRRWLIDNYICKQQDEFEYVMDASHQYDSKAMSVEHYHTSVTGTYSAGATVIGIEAGYGLQLTGNMYVTFGPNKDGLQETIQVQSTVDGEITLSDPTTLEFGLHPGGASYDPNGWSGVHFYTYLWFFNNYNGLDGTTGALYKMNAYSGSYITKYPGGAYKDITASTFYKVDSFIDSAGDPIDVDTLVYAKASNLLFIDVSAGGGELPYYGSMVMDNANAVIYDLAMYDQNVYRLQSGYNYELSTLDKFVSSIALVASPAIIVANSGLSEATIDAYVKDQFFQPVVARQVSFGDDDGVGAVAPATDNTDSQGRATTVYSSGDTARQVQITATVQQT